MNRFAMIVLVLSAVVIAGCSSPSIHPLYAPESLTQDSGLVGEWATNGATVTRVIVTERPDGRYGGALTVHHGAELKAELGLELSLTRIGDDEYVDLFLAQPDRERLASRYGFLALPVHQFMMLKREEDSLRVWSFDADWISQAGAEHGFACEVLPVGGRNIAVVTADSGSLRDHLRRHAHDPGALAPPMLLHRVQEGSSSATPSQE